MSTSRRVSRWVVGTGIAGTVFIAGLAFWLSFTALTHLAVRAGIAEGQAWAWPLIVDGIIVVATVAVVALRERRGQSYAWLLLIAGALVSVTANAVQAAMPAGVALAPSLAAAVSAVPPVVLLAVTHLTVVLARHDTHAGSPASTAPVPLSVSADVPATGPSPDGDSESTPATPTPAAVLAPTKGDAVTAPAIGGTVPDPGSGQDEPTPTLDLTVSSGPDAGGLSEAGLRRLLLGIDTATGPDTGSVGEVSRTFLAGEAKRLKQRGLTNRAIGERLGVNPTTVGRWLKKPSQETTDE